MWNRILWLMEKSTITIQSTSHNEIFRGQIFMEFYQIEQFKIEYWYSQLYCTIFANSKTPIQRTMISYNNGSKFFISKITALQITSNTYIYICKNKGLELNLNVLLSESKNLKSYKLYWILRLMSNKCNRYNTIFLQENKT